MVSVGIQWNGTLAPNQTQTWFTHNWPEDWHVIWYMNPTTPVAGAPQLEWDVQVERATITNITYWITVKNLTNTSVNFEGRYAVLN
jgi:hypothetical protein